MALAVWGFIWWRSSRGPLQEVSPTALFSAGIMLLYIIPALYWQFRPWVYYAPPYFEGTALVMLGAFILGLPFVFYEMVEARDRSISQPLDSAQPVHPSFLFWVFTGPILLGMALRIYLFFLGYQSRLGREDFTIGGSASLGLIVNNFTVYYPACYFALIAFGTRLQKFAGKTFWVLDGLLMLWTLHRYEILIYLLYSMIFIRLQGWTLTLKHRIIAVSAIVFVLAIIGQTSGVINEELNPLKSYASPLKTLQVIIKATETFSLGEDYSGKWGNLSSGTDMLSRALDNTMYRLYDARSASAVMYNVPKIIPYYYGETFMQILYAYIPRYFWEAKPDLAEIHKVTVTVMPEGGGISPCGTIAEFYMNYGFTAVFLGGIVCLAVCRWAENSLNRQSGVSPALYCIYPILGLLFIWASDTFTRRMAQGLRTLLVMGLLALVFHLAGWRGARVALRHSACLPELCPDRKESA